MANAPQFNFRKFESHFKQVLQYAPGMLGNDAVNFFLDRFKDQAWLGSTREAWPARKVNTKWGKTKRNGRAILVDTGRLRRSVRITAVGSMSVTIGSDVPYAKAHNEGLTLGLIQDVQSHTRKVNKGAKTVTVSGHKRRVDMKIPRRQFMGYSQYLDKQLQRRLMAELMKGLR